MEKKSRSQKRYEKNLYNAYEKREKLLENDRISKPLATLAIYVSTATNLNSSTDPRGQIEAFIEEGEALKHRYASKFNEVVLYTSVNKRLIDMDLADEEVSAIITVGHGCMGDFMLSGGEHYTWHDVAKATKYLKHSIVQRTCGTVAKGVWTAPWGTFAVADQRQLYLPNGLSVPDINPDDECFQPIYTEANNNPETIMRIVEQAREISRSERDRILLESLS